MKSLIITFALTLVSNTYASSNFDIYKEIGKRLIAIEYSNDSASESLSCDELGIKKVELEASIIESQEDLNFIRREIDLYNSSNSLVKFIKKSEYRQNIFAGHAARDVNERAKNELEVVNGILASQCPCYEEVMSYFKDLRSGSYHDHQLGSAFEVLGGEAHVYDQKVLTYDGRVILYEAKSEAYGALGVDAIAADPSSCDILRSDLVHLSH